MQYINNVGYINKVELQGVVGSTTNSGFTLLTVDTFKLSDGSAFCMNTWHNVLYADTSNILKQDVVHIIGRMKTQSYTNSDGETISLSVVIATEIEHV